MHELVIRAGTVVDGTGAAPRTADVAVDESGIIVEVGRVDGLARRVVDADGVLVTPGFVDVHTHCHLPAGAGRLVQRAVGYVGTFVAGVQTLDHDDLTDQFPGRLVRGAR